MENSISVLERMGLSSSEAVVYTTLLKYGQARAGAIAKNTKLHRRTVYDALEKMTANGLASRVIKNNQAYFEAVNPEFLKSLIKEKEVALDEIMPKLLTMRSPQKSEAKIFTGRYGLKVVFEDQIKEGKPIMIYGASQLAYKIFRLYFKWYGARRKKYKIHVKAIFSSSLRDRIKSMPFTEIRFLPEKYIGPVAMNIYGDKVSMILWSTEEPFALLIENKDMAESYKKFFELAWKRAKE
jgi:sugar-specific transcriptional regulator TrmB